MTITLVIPTFNGAKFLKDCIESVERQTLLPSEIIVVDDCSTDGTIDVINSNLMQFQIPIRVIQLMSNSGGPSKPINIGVGLASTEYVMVLDQDDVLRPNALECLTTAIKDHPNAHVAIHFASYYHEGSTAKPIQRGALADQLSLFDEQIGGHRVIPRLRALSLMVDFGNFVIGYPGFIFRRTAWQLKKGVDENLSIAGDMDFLSWLFCMGDVVLVPQIGYERRVHGSNASNNLSLSFFEMAIVYTKIAINSRSEISNATYKQAVEKVRGTEYWFRKGHLFDRTAELQECLKSLGIRRFDLLNLRLKLVGEKFNAWVLKNPPVLSNYTKMKYG